MIAQVFSCEFYEISKNTFFTEHLGWLLLGLSYSILHTVALKQHTSEMQFSHINLAFQPYFPICAENTWCG